MNIPDLMTDRLRLVAITPAMLDAEALGSQYLAALLNVRVPPEWPDENWQPHVLDFIRRQISDRPSTASWHRYVVLPAAEAVLIGAVGAFPKDGDAAEVGYSVLRPWQSNGLATEAVRALLQHLFAAGVANVSAQTFPHLPQSIRVMQKCGMVPAGAGDQEGTVRFALQRV